MNHKPCSNSTCATAATAGPPRAPQASVKPGGFHHHAPVCAITRPSRSLVNLPPFSAFSFAASIVACLHSARGLLNTRCRVCALHTPKSLPTLATHLMAEMVRASLFHAGNSLPDTFCLVVSPNTKPGKLAAQVSNRLPHSQRNTEIMGVLQRLVHKLVKLLLPGQRATTWYARARGGAEAPPLIPSLMKVK